MEEQNGAASAGDVGQKTPSLTREELLEIENLFQRVQILAGKVEVIDAKMETLQACKSENSVLLQVATKALEERRVALEAKYGRAIQRNTVMPNGEIRRNG